MKKQKQKPKNKQTTKNGENTAENKNTDNPNQLTKLYFNKYHEKNKRTTQEEKKHNKHKN